jgi:hypothetical protein
MYLFMFAHILNLKASYHTVTNLCMLFVFSLISINLQYSDNTEL